MLVLLLIFALLIAGAAALLGGSLLALTVALASFAAFAFAVLLSWLRCGRDLLPLSAIPSIAIYVVAKFALYRGLLRRGAVATWIRTDRAT
jgi:hypothetical protein